MGLLVAFFVMLVAFSTQDQKKLQIVAGSMREAFGTQTATRYSGIIEIDGLPTRPQLKNAAHIKPEDASATPSPDEKSRNRNVGARARQTTAPSRSPRRRCAQALQDMPEIAELSKHIMIEETKQGLNIEIVDQNGRSMFPEGSKEPYERTRRLVQRLAAQFKALPYRISIAGHTSATRLPGGPATGRGICPPIAPTRCARSSKRRACRPSHFFMVAGRADTQPLFPDDPYVAANRRVTITLMREAPPMPPEFQAVIAGKRLFCCG